MSRRTHYFVILAIVVAVVRREFGIIGFIGTFVLAE